MHIDICDTKIFFEVFGSKLIPAGPDTKEKPTFIFIHGGAGFLDHTTYLKFWSQFADVAQVIFIDARGSGRSQNDNPDTWNMEQWGKDIHLFCQALNIEKPIVGGISFGGMVAMSYVHQYPDHPAGIILTDTDVKVDRDEILRLVTEKLRENNQPIESGLAITKQFLDGPWTDEVVRAYMNDILNLFGNPPAILDDFTLPDPKYTNSKLGERFIQKDLFEYDYRNKLSNTPCPVLFLSGDQGPMHSLKTAKELIAAFPEDKIEYHIFENAKPACYEFCPERAAEIIRQFIHRLDHQPTR